MVVAFHVFTALAGASSGEHARSFLAAGVDIFFVISGFVMVVSTENRKPGFRKFMLMRLIRIAPPYWLATFAALCLSRWVLHGIPQVRDVLLSCLFIPFTNSINGQPMPVLGTGWTLNYELFFYLCFGASLALPRKAQLCVLAAIFAALVSLRPLVAHFGALPLRFTSPLFFEFLVGALLGTMKRTLVDRSSYLGYSLIAGGLLLGISETYWGAGIPRTLGFGVPSVLLVAGAVMGESLFSSRAFQTLIFLGNASYSIYLFHVFPIAFFESLTQEHAPWFSGSVFLFSVGFGVLAYVLVERPILSAGRILIKHSHNPLGLFHSIGWYVRSE